MDNLSTGQFVRKALDGSAIVWSLWLSQFSEDKDFDIRMQGMVNSSGGLQFENTARPRFNHSNLWCWIRNRYIRLSPCCRSPKCNSCCVSSIVYPWFSQSTSLESDMQQLLHFTKISSAKNWLQSFGFYARHVHCRSPGVVGPFAAGRQKAGGSLPRSHLLRHFNNFAS